MNHSLAHVELSRITRAYYDTSYRLTGLDAGITDPRKKDKYSYDRSEVSFRCNYFLHMREQ